MKAWLIARTGLDPDGIQPPIGGRAPGWGAGLVLARRQMLGAQSGPRPIAPTAHQLGGGAVMGKQVLSRARRATFSAVLADDFLPVYDVSDEVATVVDAEPQIVWEALMHADLLEVGKRVPLAGVLGALRMLPEIVSDLLHGERPAHAPESLRVRELAQMQPEQGGWILLGERAGEEIALGLVGKFWRPVIQYAQVSADRFVGFDEPGYAKTVYDLSVRPLPEGRSMLSGLMRTATTDEHARRWFRRYWTFGVGSGAHVLVHALLETVRDTAERGPAGTHSPE